MRIIIYFEIIAILLLGVSNSIAQETKMEIGVNLSGSQYWSDGENPFKDYMKYSEEFLAYYDFEWDNEILDLIPRDENGYPNAGIPYSIDVGGTIGVKDLHVRKMISAVGRIPQTQYVFLYDGNGTFTFEGSISVTNTQPGRIELTCTGDENISVAIESSDPAPNYARNFRLIRLKDEATYTTDIWRQEFIDKISPFTTIRFMDWILTNDSPIWKWEQRTMKDYNSQGGASGVAYEYVIKMCNDLQIKPWVCIPHMADSNYIAQMANLFRDSLDTKLDIYIEYSNEVWNWQFEQASWVDDDFTWLDPNFPHNQLYNSTKSQPFNTGLLAKRMFRIWRHEFGKDSLRIKRVLASQHGWPWVAEQMVEAVAGYYDYLSPAWYFGTNPTVDFSSSITAEEVIDSCRREFFDYKDELKEHYAIAKRDGKKVIHYEGGQHITAFGDENFYGLQAFYDAQVHPNIYVLYKEVLDSLKDWGAELLIAYTLAGGDSKDGSWGHIKDVDMNPTMENAPKYLALKDFVVTSTNKNNKTNIPNNFSISQNYPNPFNPTTTIEYTIPSLETLHAKPQLVQLKVYDILGKEIATLVNKKQKPGNYKVQFDALKFSSGMYFYELRFDDFGEMKKMIFIK